jgi:hypothetical protein
MATTGEEGLWVTLVNNAFIELRGCCLHDEQWAPDDVEEVLVAWYTGGDEGGGPRLISVDDFEGSSLDPVHLYGPNWSAQWKPSGNEDGSIFVVSLKDGGYGLLEESEDYTGHGCQCSAFTGRYDTIEELLLGVEQWRRTEVRSALVAAGVIENSPEEKSRNA